jgi:hypothetical protein
MNLEQLAGMLDEMEPGGSIAIHHDTFADLFPPGEPDEFARESCQRFAHLHGCQIRNWPGPFFGEGELWFEKNAPRP